MGYVHLATNHAPQYFVTFRSTIFSDVTLSITAEDADLVASTPSSSEITVSRVHDVELHSEREHVQAGNSLELSVDVFGAGKRAFGQSQTSKMDMAFHMVPEDALFLSPSNRTDDAAASTVHFNAIAEAGRENCRTVTLWVEIDGVSSRHITVTIFPVLKLSPDPVILIAGGSLTLKVDGGPTLGHRNYHVLNPAVATIDASGHVRAISRGQTTLSLQVLVNGRIVAEDATYVRVVHLEGIILSSPTENILIGSSLRLSIRGSRGESPLSFSNVPDLNFDWHFDVGAVELDSAGVSALVKVSLCEVV